MPYMTYMTNMACLAYIAYIQYRPYGPNTIAVVNMGVYQKPTGRAPFCPSVEVLWH